MKVDIKTKQPKMLKQIPRASSSRLKILNQEEEQVKPLFILRCQINLESRHKEIHKTWNTSFWINSLQQLCSEEPIRAVT